MLKLSVKVGVSLKADNWAVASVAWDCFAFSVEPLWPETCLTPQVGDKAATMVERMRSLLPLRFRRTLDGDKCAINIIKSLVRTEDQRAELQDINRMCTPLGRFWPSCCRRINKKRILPICCTFQLLKLDGVRTEGVIACVVHIWLQCWILSHCNNKKFNKGTASWTASYLLLQILDRS